MELVSVLHELQTVRSYGTCDEKAKFLKRIEFAPLGVSCL